jgi:hypothetical protein
MGIDVFPSHGVKPTWGFHKVKLRKVETRRHAPGFQLYKRVEGRIGSPGIRLGRGTSRSSLNLHQNKPPTWLVHKSRALWLTWLTTAWTQEYATTILPIVYSVTLGGTHARMSLFPETPETPGTESRNCSENYPGRSPGTLGAHNSRLQSLIATRS